MKRKESPDKAGLKIGDAIINIINNLQKECEIRRGG